MRRLVRLTRGRTCCRPWRIWYAHLRIGHSRHARRRRAGSADAGRRWCAGGRCWSGSSTGCTRSARSWLSPCSPWPTPASICVAGARPRRCVSRLTWAVAVGLVVGKTSGIAGAVFAVRRLGGGALPAGTPAPGLAGCRARRHRLHGGAVHRRPRFHRERLITQAKVGIFAGSITAALLGLGLLLLVSRAPAGARTPDAE